MNPVYSVRTTLILDMREGEQGAAGPAPWWYVIDGGEFFLENGNGLRLGETHGLNPPAPVLPLPAYELEEPQDMNDAWFAIEARGNVLLLCAVTGE